MEEREREIECLFICSDTGRSLTNDDTRLFEFSSLVVHYKKKDESGNFRLPDGGATSSVDSGAPSLT